MKFNIERIKPNTDETVYRIIDTSKIYYEISITDNFRKPVNFPGYKANYLKFYKNGRVTEFSDVDFEDENSFNPKKAKSYLYNYKKEKLIIQVYFKANILSAIVKQFSIVLSIPIFSVSSL